ncbi:hypothetical protein [Sphingomonas flavescens]|jgi:hypothetical protein|uniref:hypothetical protein n=1 Tax=Sphingomonas flavescens TaxID=3132797 RepID=UPI0028065349|nr:hypothetical protein [Sphingomonas limnosediminicola]
MESRQTRQQLLARGEIVSPPAERACTDQTFELPTGIYVAMAALFAGFVGVLGTSFRSGHLAVVYGVICVFLAAFFAIPAIFPSVGKRQSRRGSMDWWEFRENGIVTATGHASAREATILVLLLPFLILCFAIAIVTISGMVS